MIQNLQSKRLATKAVHAGERAKPDGFVPMSTPIYSTSTFLYDHLADIDAISSGDRTGFTYSRHGNPTNAAFEEAVALLEGGHLAVSSASGMSAILLALMAAGVEQGSRIAASRDLYGVTVKFLLDIAARWGAQIDFVDVFTKTGREELWASKPSVLLLESLTNPLLRIPDLPLLVKEAHAHKARVIVDNTFATPLLLRPLEHGADFVIHSATKYFGGHGDLTGGIVIAGEEFTSEVRHMARLVGSNLGPFEAWLALRGLKTLPLRFARQCENAQGLAEWLARNPRVEEVFYPGLPAHPDHGLLGKLFGGAGAGGVLSIKIRHAGRDEVFRFVDSLELFLKATSLGDVQSLVLYPAISSHRDLSPKQRERLGITDNLIRLSVGIEDVEDLRSDLTQAFARL
ncbi:MAG TPA: PLP-dependent aspartate aminotransferase family protein [Candidatus Acidoferrales bacterium]|nr:PLP-dependent aspartate aminotransferase family protein [Candidatus Acidoferrales bacterium]